MQVLCYECPGAMPFHAARVRDSSRVIHFALMIRPRQPRNLREAAREGNFLEIGGAFHLIATSAGVWVRRAMLKTEAEHESFIAALDEADVAHRRMAFGFDPFDETCEMPQQDLDLHDEVTALIAEVAGREPGEFAAEPRGEDLEMGRLGDEETGREGEEETFAP